MGSTSELGNCSASKFSKTDGGFTNVRSSRDQSMAKTDNRRLIGEGHKKAQNRVLCGLGRSGVVPRSFENGGAGGSRTRVRKSSAFGSTCLAKSLSLIARYPTGREDVQRAQLGFSELALNIPQRDLVRVDPGDLSAQAHVRPRALRQVIKLLVRSCRRWQL
jgi:hypothetical protein